MTQEEARKVAVNLSYSLGMTVYVIEDAQLGRFSAAASPIGADVKIVETVAPAKGATPGNGAHGRFSRVGAQP
jgi:hypothetical protein